MQHQVLKSMKRQTSFVVLIFKVHEYFSEDSVVFTGKICVSLYFPSPSTIPVLTFTGTTLTYEPHHEGSALVTLSGRVE